MLQRKALAEQMEQAGIIAIARGVSPSDMLETAEALADGGIKFLEVTFNQKNVKETLQSLELLASRAPKGLHIGAGTVLSTKQVEQAYDMGAKYIVTPNTDRTVIAKAGERSMAVVAGALTPSEAVVAYDAGADYIKIFPAGTLGLPYIKSLRGPLSHIPFFAVGGIDLSNIGEAFAIGIKGVGLGSNLVRTDLIQQQRFSELTEIAKQYVKKVDERE